MNDVAVALISILATSLLAWLVGVRVSHHWDEARRRRESDMAALQAFYAAYGKFFEAWKLWDTFLRNHRTLHRTEGAQRGNGPIPLEDPTAWSILELAAEAESSFESILVKLASEGGDQDSSRTQLLAAFRQGAQSLREAMRDGRALTWKAQPTSPSDNTEASRTQRRLDYRRYRSFKALSLYAAHLLETGGSLLPSERHTRDGNPWRLRVRRYLIGPGLEPSLATSRPVASLIAMTVTQGVAPRWWEIAERELLLPPVDEK